METHFASLKAEVDTIKAKLEATQKERDALSRKVNDLQSRLSRAGGELSGKKGKLGLRGGGNEGEASTPIYYPSHVNVRILGRFARFEKAARAHESNIMGRERDYCVSLNVYNARLGV